MRCGGSEGAKPPYRLDYQNFDPIPERGENTNQQITGYVLQIAVQDGGDSRSRRACSLRDVDMSNFHAPHDLLEALDQRVQDLPLLCFCGGQCQRPSQFLGIFAMTGLIPGIE